MEASKDKYLFIFLLYGIFFQEVILLFVFIEIYRIIRKIFTFLVINKVLSIITERTHIFVLLCSCEICHCSSGLVKISQLHSDINLVLDI